MERCGISSDGDKTQNTNQLILPYKVFTTGRSIIWHFYLKMNKHYDLGSRDGHWSKSQIEMNIYILMRRNYYSKDEGVKNNHIRRGDESWPKLF